MSGVRYLLLVGQAPDSNQIIAIHDQTTYDLLLNRLTLTHDIKEIAVEAVISLIQEKKAIGVGVYLADADNVLETHCNRAEALHRFVRFMIKNLNETPIVEPIKLFSRIDLVQSQDTNIGSVNWLY